MQTSASASAGPLLNPLQVLVEVDRDSGPGPGSGPDDEVLFFPFQKDTAG